MAGIAELSSARSARLRAKKPSCRNAAAAVVAMNSVRKTYPVGLPRYLRMSRPKIENTAPKSMPITPPPSRR
jgi:hypothetical protein